MRCQNCFTPNPDSSNYCMNCGKPLGTWEYRTCPNCKKRVVASSAFCRYCGASLEEDMKICRKCGKKMPFKKDNCPNCGYPNESMSQHFLNKTASLLGVILAAFILVLVYSLANHDVFYRWLFVEYLGQDASYETVTFSIPLSTVLRPFGSDDTRGAFLSYGIMLLGGIILLVKMIDFLQLGRKYRWGKNPTPKWEEDYFNGWIGILVGEGLLLIGYSLALLLKVYHVYMRVAVTNDYNIEWYAYKECSADVPGLAPILIVGLVFTLVLSIASIVKWFKSRDLFSYQRIEKNQGQ